MAEHDTQRGRGTAVGEVLSAESFRRLAELAPDGMLAHREGKVVWANLAVAKLAGLDDPAQLVGTSIFDFVLPQSRSAIAADIARTLAAATGNTYQHTFVRRNGQAFEAELQRWPIGEGLMLVVVRDLEGARAAERSQRSAELRARAFFDATTEAMGISRRGVHVEANPAYARLFRYDAPAQLVGLPIFDLIDESEHARVSHLVARRSRGEPVPSSYAVRARRRDGSTFLMDVKGSSYLDGDA